MSENNPEILFKNHLKIYILLKDKIIFENELENNNIQFYCDIEKQPSFEEGIRYYIQDIDRMKLDIILKENGIIAHTDINPISDYRDYKKVISLYLKIALIVTVIIIFIIIIESLYK
jgi:hypothetical protein